MKTLYFASTRTECAVLVKLGKGAWEGERERDRERGGSVPWFDEKKFMAGTGQGKMKADQYWCQHMEGHSTFPPGTQKLMFSPPLKIKCNMNRWLMSASVCSHQRVTGLTVIPLPPVTYLRQTMWRSIEVDLLWMQRKRNGPRQTRTGPMRMLLRRQGNLAIGQQSISSPRGKIVLEDSGSRSPQTLGLSGFMAHIISIWCLKHSFHPPYTVSQIPAVCREVLLGQTLSSVNLQSVCGRALDSIFVFWVNIS